MINIIRIRQQVQKAIEALPSLIDLKRIDKIDDGFGGYTEGEIPVKLFNGFIDFSTSKPQIEIYLEDKGAITSAKNITLLAAYDPSFEIKKDDYFMFKGTKYRIRYPINQFDIYWECELEGINDGS